MDVTVTADTVPQPELWRMTMTALLVVIATLVVIYFAFRPKRNSQSSGAASPRYSCMRCDMPYAIPDVPMRCRSCGGMVEKL